MIYNDNPILNELDYLTIDKHYQSTQTLDRKTLVLRIYNELSSCLNNCLLIENRYNKNIQKLLKSTSITVDKHLNNLSTLFNLPATKTQSASSFNLFTFLKKINKTCLLLIEWLKIEDKEYYKTTLIKTLNELLGVCKEMFSTLENSEIHFFKYM